MASGSLVGRLGSGVLVDRVPARTCLAVVPLATAVSIATSTVWSNSVTVAAAALWGMGLTYGMNAVAISVIVSRTVGSSLFSEAYSWVFTAWGAGGVIAPWLAGRLFDLTGGYRAALVVASASAVAASFAALALPSDAHAVKGD
mmetsp:Transcript_49337/g.139693  ORF Transcript_49337/g.139693 Transcript_49337/m.139693 type:complete len:144 (+) Transcript_49337:1430-1861(+)